MVLVADAVLVPVVVTLETIENRAVPGLASGARRVDVAVGVALLAPVAVRIVVDLWCAHTVSHGVTVREVWSICMCACVHGCKMCTSLRAWIIQTMTTMPMMSWMMPAMKSSTLACGKG